MNMIIIQERWETIEGYVLARLHRVKIEVKDDQEVRRTSTRERCDVTWNERRVKQQFDRLTEIFTVYYMNLF